MGEFIFIYQTLERQIEVLIRYMYYFQLLNPDCKSAQRLKGKFGYFNVYVLQPTTEGIFN